MYFTKLKCVENKSYPPFSTFKPVEKQALMHEHPTVKKNVEN